MASPNETTYGSAGSAASDVKDQVTKQAQKIGDEISQTAGRAQEQALEQIDKLSDSIRSKPLQAAAIAAGLGFLFAVVARR